MNSYPNLEARAFSAPWWGGIELLFRSKTDGKIAVAESMTLRVLEAKDEGMVMEPTARLSREHAQTLMDDLWNCGIRPTEGSGSAGSLAATERHLSDMRHLVFDTKPTK